MKFYNHVTHQWDEINIEQMTLETAKLYIPERSQKRLQKLIRENYDIREAFLITLSEAANG